MKRLLFALALLFGVQTASAADRAGEILEKVAAGFRSLGAYGVSFEVVSGEYSTRGRYTIDGWKYYITLGDAEVYCDGKARYEVDNRRKEVTIDNVNTSSRNILDNPAYAFDFIGSEYRASLVSETDTRVVVRLVPTSSNASPAGAIILTVDTASMRPVSLDYDYDGERVHIAVLGISKLEIPLKTFSKEQYAGYELIDFR
ncbi:LolA-like putative outer membrane lipoprotein chaperone [uncultured Alistipes sp.]|jgi:hypothetical protein|uniref:LolA-like putative outer membrane lipoprotein chaperone n=1 Tax=uncultured Alistipes sp. TaxID=538949 RepID=UPI0025F8113A|nr:LolA-like putative outer membrane lipoprotein chaperone [uncultured Alistipes sp.]